jgi:hypothetical protein
MAHAANDPDTTTEPDITLAPVCELLLELEEGAGGTVEGTDAPSVVTDWVIAVVDDGITEEVPLMEKSPDSEKTPSGVGGPVADMPPAQSLADPVCKRR